MGTIAVLGSGLSAVPVIRQAMVQVVSKSKDYRLLVVAPNTHYYFPVAMPRAIVPCQLSDDKIPMDLEPQFSRYPANKNEFILGATS